MSKLDNVRISLKIDDLSNWNNSNITLNNGEIALIRLPNDQVKIKIGDGSSQINALNYINEQEFFTSKLSASNAEFGLRNFAQRFSVAEGQNVSAYGTYQHAAGYNVEAISNETFAFVWNGKNLYGYNNRYKSHGAGTFSINPENGLSGFYIGEQHLADILYSNISNEISPLITNINNNNAAINANFIALNNKTDTISSNVKTLSTDVSSLKTNVSTISNDVKTANNNITSLNTTLTNQINAVDAKLTGYAKTTDLNSYAKTADLTSYATKTELADYAKTSALTSYATKTELTNNTTPLSNDVKTLKSNDNILSSKIDNKISIDGLFTEQLEVKHISRDEYYNLVNNNQVLSNAIYMVSADTINAYNQKIENVADGENEFDAANMRQLSYKLVDIELVDNGTNLSCQLENRTISKITIDSDAKPIVIAFPNIKTGYARDFILQVNVTLASTENLQIEWEGLDDSWNTVSESDDWAVLEPGLNVISFTEMN